MVHHMVSHVWTYSQEPETQSKVPYIIQQTTVGRIHRNYSTQYIQRQNCAKRSYVIYEADMRHLHNMQAFMRRRELMYLSYTCTQYSQNTNIIGRSGTTRSYEGEPSYKDERDDTNKYIKLESNRNRLWRESKPTVKYGYIVDGMGSRWMGPPKVRYAGACSRKMATQNIGPEEVRYAVADSQNKGSYMLQQTILDRRYHNYIFQYTQHQNTVKRLYGIYWHGRGHYYNMRTWKSLHETAYWTPFTLIIRGRDHMYVRYIHTQNRQIDNIMGKSDITGLF